MADQNMVNEEVLLDVRVAEASKLYKFYLNQEKKILGILSVGVFLLIWELIGNTLQLINPMFMSAPSLIWKAAVQLFGSGEIWNDLYVSGIEFGWGYLLSVIVGVPFGIAIGWYKRFAYICDPFVNAMNAAIRDRLERQHGAPRELDRVLARREPERVMRDQRLEHRARHRAEHPLDLRDLLQRDATALAREAASGVETQHRDFIVLKQRCRQELQRHKPAQFCVFGFVNHSHAAAPDLRQDFVVGDGLAQETQFVFIQTRLGLVVFLCQCPGCYLQRRRLHEFLCLLLPRQQYLEVDVPCLVEREREA